MPRYGPVHRDELIRSLRHAGFIGPEAGGKHPIMTKGSLTIHIPNSHRGDIDITLLKRILRQAGLSREDWERL
jgi:predicted RNA binding protein YcfA (HicA-like mRNA interferase family)